MRNSFGVAVGARTVMSGSGAAVRFSHGRAPGRVTLDANFTGGNLLHLAAVGCILNDLCWEPRRWASE